MSNNNQTELRHYGILGMKWGIRRYQNKDGTLTPAGKKKAAKMKDEYTALTGKRLIRKPSPKTTPAKPKAKSLKDLSDTELREKINRLQMEKQAIQLQSDLASKGEKFTSHIAKQIITPAATSAGKQLLTDLLVKIGKEKLGLNPEVAKDVMDDLRKEVDGLELEARKIKAQQTINKNKKSDEPKKTNEAKNEKPKNNEPKKEKPKNENEKVKVEVIKPNSTKYKSTDKNSTVIDADWRDVPVNSNELSLYVEKGEKYKKRWYR